MALHTIPDARALRNRLRDSGANGDFQMNFIPVVGLTLLIQVATGPVEEASTIRTPMSAQQMKAVMQPLVSSATECIAKTVTADPRFGEASGDIANLIVDSMPSCLTPVRAMIDAYDRHFGDGSGEAFFMGPYLDVLPTAVSRWNKSRGQ
jgi:hypothetical protein